MFLSLCYAVLSWVLQLAALHVRSNDFKELEIVVLRPRREPRIQEIGCGRASRTLCGKFGLTLPKRLDMTSGNRASRLHVFETVMN